MTNLENVYIAITFNEREETEFAKKIKENKSEFTKLDNFFINRANNILFGDIDSIVSEIDIDFQEKADIETVKKNDTILFVIKDSEDEFKLVEIRLNPEIEYDWIETINNFLLNIQETKPNSDDQFKWGQIVQEDGEYLCVDCGFILELKEGDIFPICEVCLSGDPSSPDSKSDEGFWEKV